MRNSSANTRPTLVCHSQSWGEGMNSGPGGSILCWGAYAHSGGLQGGHRKARRPVALP